MKKLQWKLLVLLAVCIGMMAFAVPAHAALSNGTEAVVTASSLNLRKSPSTSSSHLATISKGSTVIIRGVNSDKTWYKVSYNGTVGYASASYIKSLSAAKEQKLVSTRVMAVSVRMKKSASDGAGNITAINSGKGYLPVNKTVVYLGAANSKYYKISAYGYTGYVAKGYFTNEVTYRTTKTAVNLREKASTSSKRLATIAANTKVVVLGKSGTFWKCYAKVGSGYRQGYIKDGYFKAVSSTMTTTDNVRLRRGPGTSYDTILVIPKGKKVTVTARGTTWHTVSYNGNLGYVMAKYLK